MTPMTAALIVAAVANTAAVIALVFARRELDRAERAIESVSSSRASRLEAEAADRSCSLRNNHSFACTPMSPLESANCILTCDSPSESNTSQCDVEIGPAIHNSPRVKRARFVTPNV